MPQHHASPATADPAAICVTAADQRFARSLFQLLRSAERQRLVAGNRWIAYDLGMGQSRQELETRFPWCEFRSFDHSAWPAHVGVVAGTFAWKPVVFWDVVEAASGPVCWFDSATIFKAPLDPMLDTIRATGVYALRGQSAIQARCEPAVMQRLEFPRRLWGTRECIGGVLGIDAANPVARAIARTWRDLALDPELISPSLRTIPRHMHDQALLSCLLLSAADRGDIVLGDDDVDISSPRPVKFLSTRNKIGATVPYWADPMVRAKFALEKFADQTWLKIDKGDGPQHIPFKWRGEYFEVRYRGPDGAERVVPCPFGHYYADPFIWSHDGRRWILLEDFAYLRGRATIAAVPLDGDLHTGKAVAVLDPGVHASFPFLLAHAGRTYMVPETGKSGGIDLYECERFPDRWTRRRRLIDGVNGADTAIFQHAGKWWLVTSLASPNPGGAHRYLAVFHADDPVEGDWRPHPVNEQALYIEAPSGTGRNAGAIIARGGRIFRPMQKSQNFYAEGMAVMEIVDLSETAYREVPAAPPHPFADIATRRCVHHVTEAGGITTWDVRVRY